MDIDTEATGSGVAVASMAGTRTAPVGDDGQTVRRSDPRRRREWLRFLDLTMTDEINNTGALSRDELIALAAQPLRGRASDETIREWWEYARRRGWLEEHEADRHRLTSTGRADARARRERMSQPNPVALAKGLMKWVLPAGAIGAAGYLTGRTAATALTVIAVCALFALACVLAAGILAVIDRPLERAAARRACDWLDGRRVSMSVTARSEVRGPVKRLYDLPVSD